MALEPGLLQCHRRVHPPRSLFHFIALLTRAMPCPLLGTKDVLRALEEISIV